jgi:hypothetical protein
MHHRFIKRHGKNKVAYFNLPDHFSGKVVN